MGASFIPIVSLFCGAGGLDLGFRNEGFRVVLALDEDKSAVETYNANDPARCALERDLRHLKEAELIRLVKDRAPGIQPRGVVGGPPCQTFSVGNVRKSRYDRRGALGLHYARLLKALNAEFNLDFLFLKT
jgi:DNA (cytosine-5)-methyltransferase 1